jgi:hypothetical protein
MPKSKETPTSRGDAASPEDVVEGLADLVREAAVPGGVGPHEFSRPGGWRERAVALLERLDENAENAEPEEARAETQASRLSR